MSLIDSAKKSRSRLALAGALMAAATLGVMPGTAYAKHWDHDGNWGHHGHWHGGGGGVALGLLGGALAGAAIASATSPYYYPYAYSPAYCYSPYYGYYTCPY